MSVFDIMAMSAKEADQAIQNMDEEDIETMLAECALINSGWDKPVYLEEN